MLIIILEVGFYLYIWNVIFQYVCIKALEKDLDKKNVLFYYQRAGVSFSNILVLCHNQLSVNFYLYCLDFFFFTFFTRCNILGSSWFGYLYKILTVIVKYDWGTWINIHSVWGKEIQQISTVYLLHWIKLLLFLKGKVIFLCNLQKQIQIWGSLFLFVCFFSLFCVLN